jgi:hypothetical protein
LARTSPPTAYDMENFRAAVDVVVSSVFFSWVFGFEGEVVINGPEDVKEQYKELVRKIADKLLNDKEKMKTS